MKRRITATLAALIVAVMLMFNLSSCFYANNSASTEKVTTVAAPDLVKPEDVAGKLDLKKEDPSNDNVKFSFDEEGRVIECAYTKGDNSFYVGYTYRDGEVDVNTFVTDKDGNAFTVDSRSYKTGAFDKSAGFTEKDGYYFNGFKTLEENARDTRSETTEKAAESDTKKDGADTSDTTAAEDSDTEKAPVDNDTSAPADTAADTTKAE